MTRAMRERRRFGAIGCIAVMLLCAPGVAAGETLDECAAEMRTKLGSGRGELTDWYPVCREMRLQQERRRKAEEEQRAAGVANPAKAGEKQLQLENCQRLANPTWEGKQVSRAWWEAHCRWFTGQPGAKRPPNP